MKLLHEGRLYGFFILEYLLKNNIISLDILNFVDLGMTQEELEIGLEYLTITNVLTRQSQGVLQ